MIFKSKFKTKGLLKSFIIQTIKNSLINILDHLKYLIDIYSILDKLY